MSQCGEDHEPEAISDEQLVRLVASGDEEAFDQVYLRYKAKLRKFIGGFIEDNQAAEDLLQETFLRVYRHAERYEHTHSFAAWLYRIAANLCLNELRRRRTHPHISLNQRVQFAVTESETESVELGELIPDSSFAAPTRAAEESETMREIAAAIETLSAAHRDVITMHLLDDLKYEQIAEILRCSVGTVKSRAFYALRNLRDRLEPEQEDTPS
jgi:RNA polymerase sigma-70 factor (ECF subfamily)